MTVVFVIADSSKDDHSLRTKWVLKIRSSFQCACSLVSSLFQAVKKASLHADVSISLCMCLYWQACASGLSPLRPPNLDIPEKHT